MTAVQQAIYDKATATRGEKVQHEPLFDEFAKIINQKAAKLKKLRDINIFDYSEKYGSEAANFKFRETHQIEYELNILIAISHYINDMSDFQESDIVELTQTIEQKEILIAKYSEAYHNAIETIINL